MVTPFLSFFCRFWKRAGFVPVYLRQTPVSEAQGRGGVGFVSAVGTERRSLLACALGGCSCAFARDSSDGQTNSYPLSEAGVTK